MAWFKVDDGFHSSRKLMMIRRSQRIAASGLWVIAGSWSAQEELDGFVPEFMIEEWGAAPEIVEALIEADMWERVGDDFRFVNWGDYQPTRSELEEKREKERARKAAWREEKARKDAAKRESRRSPSSVPVGQTWDKNVRPVVVPAESRLSRPDPTRPDPTPISSSEIAVANPRPEVERLLDLLDELIVENGSKKPVRNKANCDAARLLIDRDGYTVEQVEYLIRWSQRDEFWRANILSMSKLRAKADQLRLKAQASAGKSDSRVQQGMSVADELRAMEGRYAG